MKGAMNVSTPEQAEALPNRFYSISDIRRENLVDVIRRYFDDNQTRLAERMCVQASVISRWVKGNRTVGNSSARRVEQAAGKPKYWLDMKHSARKEMKVSDCKPSGENPPRQKGRFRPSAAGPAGMAA